MKDILFIDTEVSGATNGTKGNPFSEPNKLCYVGCSYNDSYSDYSIEYGREPYGKKLDEIGRLIDAAKLIVGFNLKFDFHWLRRYGILSFSEKKCWDAQTFEYLVSRQRESYPSLASSAKKRQLQGTKLDVVKSEYWEKGIDTDQVPESILRGYLQTDVDGLTKPLYEAQERIYKTLPERMQTLFALACQDLIVLQEMEWNGLPYDIKASLDEGKKLEERLRHIDDDLSSLAGFRGCNWNSPDHLSAILYGGSIKEEFREPYVFNYVDGRQVTKVRRATREHVFPPLVEPVKNTGLKKEGFWSTDEATLKKLRGSVKVQQIVSLLLERAKIDKLKGTYFEGFPKKHDEMLWEPDILHGQLNQCVTTTGRLASSGPNQQNIPEPIRGIIKTRFL